MELAYVIFHHMGYTIHNNNLSSYPFSKHAIMISKPNNSRCSTDSKLEMDFSLDY